MINESVTVLMTKFQYTDEMKDWLDNTIPGKFRCVTSDHWVSLEFHEPDDILLFKLSVSKKGNWDMTTNKIINVKDADND